MFLLFSSLESCLSVNRRIIATIFALFHSPASQHGPAPNRFGDALECENVPRLRVAGSGMSQAVSREVGKNNGKQ